MSTGAELGLCILQTHNLNLWRFSGVRHVWRSMSDGRRDEWLSAEKMEAIDESHEVESSGCYWPPNHENEENLWMKWS